MSGGPLDGVVVVAFEAIGPVPFACRVLSSLGARIVTIARPPSIARSLPEDLRATSAPVGVTVAIDIKEPAGRDVVMRVVGTADVVLEGFRPGVMERLGLGPDAVHAEYPPVVYARVTGWGQDGPYASMAGHDINYIGLTGVLHAIGPDDLPVPPLNLVGDNGGGAMFAIAGILAGVIESRRTGRGRVVDVAMIDAAATLLSPIRDLMRGGLWTEHRRSNLLDGGAPFYRTYETADGAFVAVGALEPAFYSSFVDGLGLDETELPNRMDPSNWPALHATFADRIRRKTRAEWSETFDGSDACCTPVLSMGEVAAHAHNRSRAALDPSGEVAAAPRFVPTSDPTTGRDVTARQFLVDIGIGESDVDRLAASGIFHDR